MKGRAAALLSWLVTVPAAALAAATAQDLLQAVRKGDAAAVEAALDSGRPRRREVPLRAHRAVVRRRPRAGRHRRSCCWTAARTSTRRTPSTSATRSGWASTERAMPRW